MEKEVPTCSTSDKTQNSELAELTLEQGINVWGTNQQVLEKQAQHELDIFTQENTRSDLEEGEIVDNKKPEKDSFLDINTYIKRQEELRKIQEHQKTLQVVDKNKLIADKFAKKQKTKAKCKRKINDNGKIGQEKKIKLVKGLEQIDMFNSESVPEDEVGHGEYQRILQVADKNKLITDKILKEQEIKCKRKCNKVKVNLEKTTELDQSDFYSGSEYVPSDDDIDSEFEQDKHESGHCKRKNNGDGRKGEKFRDDGCLEHYKYRLEEYYKQLDNESHVQDDDDDDDDSECPDYYTIKGGLKIPFKIWNNLYSYQQDGVRWLWRIHGQSTGCLLGDEMGLGKTVQVIAFLAGLEYSQVVSGHDRYKGLGPTLIVCPVTVIHQWVKHFHDWAPEFRVAILHQSGSYQGNRNKLIKEINKSKGILVTSYGGVLKYKESLTDYCWHYLILDEGHKIRNSNAKVSIAVKKIRTPHRLMLTGSPMQNNLQELWSLFDFTNPGMLGNLTTFMEHFNNPIVQGGFTNATPMQEATALSVATTLKNVISPFLLRRSKDEVKHHISLPNKSEQVLFCSLTEQQRDLYKGFLMSDHVGSILGKDGRNWFSDNQTRANVLVAITTLRKICNHPDIYLYEADEIEKREDLPVEDKFGYYKKAGKMIVVSALLKIWKKQKHRVLLFTQSRAMITIFEEFLRQQQYKYLKMDGGTAVSSRQPLINKFNEDSSYDVFLLTTRVGGLGVNLTGADRVIIYDPDWNPATDTQARERAWRIGQDKEVTIYRLLSAGTIEEKMYQRQVWKQLLSNKVLLDPKTHKFFKSSNLHDLFSLPENDSNAVPETTNIFRDSRVKLQEKLKSEKRKKVEKDDSVQFSQDKIQQMKNLAQQIAKSITHPENEEAKTLFQVELENERRKKLAEKEELKKLTPVELMYLNREKGKRKPEPVANTVDDCETSISFSKALEFSEKTSKLYHELKTEKIKNIKQSKDSCETETKSKKKHKESKKREHLKSIIDPTGTVDGEKVDGLLKTEIKKVRKKYEKVNSNESQDEYVLEKLFSKKGVSGALQHDSIVNSNVKKQSMKVQIEARLKADKALEALRKSRLNNWRW